MPKLHFWTRGKYAEQGFPASLSCQRLSKGYPPAQAHSAQGTGKEPCRIPNFNKKEDFGFLLREA